MPKISNPTKKQTVGILDRRYSQYVRSIGFCEFCGTKENLTCSHIIGRTYIKVRWDIRNLQSLCFSCHGRFESQPLKFAEWVLSTSCGQYVDIMSQQANNAMFKPDYELWLILYEAITLRGLTVEESREFLGQQILFKFDDINLLEIEQPNSTTQPTRHQ